MNSENFILVSAFPGGVVITITKSLAYEGQGQEGWFFLFGWETAVLEKNLPFNPSYPFPLPVSEETK
jgi:hypothetical protein